MRKNELTEEQKKQNQKFYDETNELVASTFVAYLTMYVFRRAKQRMLKGFNQKTKNNYAKK